MSTEPLSTPAADIINNTINSLKDINLTLSANNDYQAQQKQAEEALMNLISRPEWMNSNLPLFAAKIANTLTDTISNTFDVTEEQSEKIGQEIGKHAFESASDNSEQPFLFDEEHTEASNSNPTPSIAKEENTSKEPEEETTKEATKETLKEEAKDAMKEAAKEAIAVAAEAYGIPREVTKKVLDPVVDKTVDNLTESAEDKASTPTLTR